jgi:hypothetical protein
MNFQFVTSQVVSNLYKDYLNLLQLSSAAGYVSKLISQIQTWHQYHPLPQAPILMDDDDDPDYSPPCFTLDEDEEEEGDVEDKFDEQIIVTELFNLGDHHGPLSGMSRKTRSNMGLKSN